MVLVDTSIWIAYQRKRGKRAGYDSLLTNLLKSGEVATCPVVTVELLRGALTEDDYRAILHLFSSLTHLAIDQKIWDQTQRLGFTLARGGLMVPMADLLIACTAIQHQCFLFHQYALFDRIAPLTSLKIYKV